MDACIVCGGYEFYVEAGYYFCKECQTQHEGKREEFADFQVDPATRLRRTRIRKDRSSSGAEQIVGWTTWEQYNFILIGLANELIELGASTDIKMTLIQLWATYLGKLEVAFTSINKKTVPKLARRYNKKDAEIIYGRILRRRKKKRSRSGDSGSGVSGSSMISSYASGGSSKAELQKYKKKLITSEYDRYMQSQNSDVDTLSMTNQSSVSGASSVSDTSIAGGEKIRFNKYAKLEAKKVKVLAKKVSRLKRKQFIEKHVTASYASGPQILTPSKLWGLLYLALRINDDKIHLSDMLRFGREGHLSYYRLEHLLPPEVCLSKVEISKLNPTKEIGHKGLRNTITHLAKFLGVVQLPHANLLSLVERYVTELQLPNGILLYAERMMATSPPNMDFNATSTLFPNYEGRAMAFIIVVMKILFGLDGITEYGISRVINRINTIAEERGVLESRLFNFCEWQRYIECRRSILVREHFPTKLRRDPHSTGTSHLYINFIQSIQSKYEGDEPEIHKFYNLVPRDLANMMKQSIERLNENMPSAKDVIEFPPSFTSQHTYLQQLLDDPDKDLPSILRQINFSTTKVGYMLKPETLIQLAAQCDVELRVVTASAHFMEKIVQTFEPPVLPSISSQRKTNNHNELTRVISPNLDKLLKTKRYDDPSEYLHRKYPGKIIIDTKKRRLYNKCQKSMKNHREKDSNDFEFDQILPDGKLKIVRSDDESEDELTISREVEKNYDLILSNFERRTLLNPIKNPWEKSRKAPCRRNGKFIKASEATDEEILNWEVENNQLRSQIRHEIMLIDNTHDSKKLKHTHDNDPIIVKEILAHEPEINNSDSDEISILTESVDSRRSSNVVNNTITPKQEILILFRPFKQFWLRRCTHISHTTPHHFCLLERDFPINFRWLLHECAYIVEMSVEELYEEVCLIENYYADVLSPNNDQDVCKKYDTAQYRSAAHLKAVKKKWNV